MKIQSKEELKELRILCVPRANDVEVHVLPPGHDFTEVEELRWVDGRMSSRKRERSIQFRYRVRWDTKAHSSMCVLFPLQQTQDEIEGGNLSLKFMKLTFILWMLLGFSNEEKTMVFLGAIFRHSTKFFFTNNKEGKLEKFKVYSESFKLPKFRKSFV